MRSRSYSRTRACALRKSRNTGTGITRTTRGRIAVLLTAATSLLAAGCVTTPSGGGTTSTIPGPTTCAPPSAAASATGFEPVARQSTAPAPDPIVHELTASADQAEIIASVDGDLHYLAVDSQLADDARAFLDAAGTVLAYGPSGRVEAVVANDPLRVEQWPLDKVAFESVWPCSTGEGTTIAITDTGVDGTHPDFGSRVLHGASSFGGTLVEGNGDVDPSGHGTHVAGIAAAGTNDGIGVAGVAPDATILPFRMLDAQGKGSTLDLAAGIIWSTDEGADVINISVAASGSSSSMDYAISYALSRGVVIVAAAGNNGASGAPSYPAASEGVVAVGASTPTNGVAAFSNSGSYIDVVAPGTDVLSTIPGGWNTVSGTSMASPHVAGLAALLESGYGPLDYTQFRNSVVSTAVDLGPAGFDVRSGHGLVNPVAATHAL